MAFAIDAISQLPVIHDDDFHKLEKVILRRVKELNPHYNIKVLLALTKAKQGSGELFS